VPVPVGSVGDVAAVTARPVTSEEVNDPFRDEASGDCYRAIPGVADDPVVFADVIGDPRASVVDAGMTRVVDGTLVKVMSWYDSEWGVCLPDDPGGVRLTGPARCGPRPGPALNT
jgi:glyceraldehyde 3-phosphate dehydrogenase